MKQACTVCVDVICQGGGEKGRGVESESGGVVEILRYTSAWQVIRAYLEPAQSPLS